MTSDGLVVAVLGRACRAMWGFTPRMIPVIVASMGRGRAVRWFLVNMPRFLVTLHVLGPIRTHLACLAVSLRNGCVYCAFGNAYALELVYLRDRGRPFPLDAATLASWRDLDARTLRGRLRWVLQQAGLHAEDIWVERTLDLADGAQPADGTEARLAHLARMVGRMNGIAVDADLSSDGGAHNPVNRNAPLKARLAALRATTT